MLDVLIGLVLLALGFVLGRRSVPRTRPAKPTVQPEERELQLLQEDRAAFSQLMGYNVDCAYGNYQE